MVDLDVRTDAKDLENNTKPQEFPGDLQDKIKLVVTDY